VVGVLEKADDDVFDVLTHVPGFRQVRGVGDGERDVENLRQGLRQERLAAPRGSQQQHIGLPELDILAVHFRVNALVVIVDGHREDLLGAFLPDDIVVENGFDLGRFRDRSQTEAL